MTLGSYPFLKQIPTFSNTACTSSSLQSFTGVGISLMKWMLETWCHHHNHDRLMTYYRPILLAVGCQQQLVLTCFISVVAFALRSLDQSPMYGRVYPYCAFFFLFWLQQECWCLTQQDKKHISQQQAGGVSYQGQLVWRYQCSCLLGSDIKIPTRCPCIQGGNDKSFISTI